MTLCFYKMGPVGQNKARRYISSSLRNGGNKSEAAVYDCTLVL